MDANDYQSLAHAVRGANQYKGPVQQIQEHHPDAIQLLHGLVGLSGEVGELATAVHRWIYYGQKLDRLNVIEELGDCCWFIARACDAVGTSLEHVMDANLRKLYQRYPKGYNESCAAEESRDRSKEREALSSSEKPIPPNAPNTGYTSPSYDRPCAVCKQRLVHVNNQLGVCPDCVSDLNCRGIILAAKDETGEEDAQKEHP